MYTRFRLLIVLLLISMLAFGGCGGGDEETAPEEEAPLALQEEAAPTSEPVEEEPVAAEEEMSDDVVQTTVDAYLTNIPAGFMAVGKIDAFQEILDSGEAFLLDVREPSEYEAGHIPGAVNIPLRMLAQNLDKIPTDQPVMAYCASGHRAALATSALQTLGYDNVRSFPPSWKGWTAAEGEVSTEMVEAESGEMPAVDTDVLAAVDGFLSSIPEGFLVVKTVEDLETAMDAGAFLIDVREEGEFANGAISGAVNIPIRELGKNLDQIPEDVPVILYCASGHRAALATAALQELGYANARSFPAGYGAWEAANATTTEVPTEIEAALDSDFAIVEQMDAYLTSIPEGFAAVGKIDAVKDMMENADVYLVDVRTPSEYEAGHIPGAVNIPLRTLADNLDKIPTDRPVLVYCASGHRAGIATSALRMLGYENVRSFPPSWKGWTAANEEVSTDAVEATMFEMADVDPEMLAAVAEFLTNIPEGYYSLGNVEKLQGALDAGATLIDVREPAEFAAGAIAGAINIPMRELAQNLDQMPTDAPIVVYCASGHRAAMSLAALQALGIDYSRSFPPGYGAWEAAQ